MSIDVHEEPWLRDALATLVATEPAMASTVVDDVRRGEAARAVVRRQRIAVVAVAAVLALVAVPAGLLLRAQPHAAAPPASSVSATPGSAADALRQRATVWLATAGWTVVSAIEPSITDGSGRTEIDLGVARSSDVAAGGTESTMLRLVSYPHGSAPGHYLATCTNESCPEAQQVPTTTSCLGRPDCYVEAGAYPRAVGGSLEWGSLVLDRRYESGVLVEIAAQTDYRVPSPATGTPVAFLSLAEAQRLLTTIGDPYATAPVPSRSPQPVPSATSDGFVADDQWEVAVVSAYAGGLTTILQHPDLTAATLTLAGREVDGEVGRLVQTQVQQGAAAAAQLASPPCLPDDPRCVVLLPWGRVTTAQGPAWLNVVDISFDQPAHRTRVATVVRGDTLLTVTSDSREVSVDFAYGASTAPGLAPDIIVARALAMPLPESMRSAAGRPMATPPGAAAATGGSASASSDPGVTSLTACDLSAMQIVVGPGSLGLPSGQHALTVHLRYAGAQDCQVSWPAALTVTASDTTESAVIDVTRMRARSLPPVRLTPGGAASFTLSTSSCTGVVTAWTTFLSITLPGGSTAVGVAIPRELGLPYCDGAATPGDHVVVSTLTVEPR